MGSNNSSKIGSPGDIGRRSGRYLHTEKTLDSKELEKFFKRAGPLWRTISFEAMISK